MNSWVVEYYFKLFKLETNQHKALKLQEVLGSVNDWTDNTSVFLDDINEVAVRDEVNMNQLTPSGATPEAVHEQIVLLKVRCISELSHQNSLELIELSSIK